MSSSDCSGYNTYEFILKIVRSMVREKDDGKRQRCASFQWLMNTALSKVYGLENQHARNMERPLLTECLGCSGELRGSSWASAALVQLNNHREPLLCQTPLQLLRRVDVLKTWALPLGVYSLEGSRCLQVVCELHLWSNVSDALLPLPSTFFLLQFGKSAYNNRKLLWSSTDAESTFFPFIHPSWHPVPPLSSRDHRFFTVFRVIKKKSRMYLEHCLQSFPQSPFSLQKYW